jgi:hypothetical protein
MLQEIAKHLGRPIETGCKLIENILDIPTKRLGDIMGDQISYWQWLNRLRIAELAAKKLKEKGIVAHSLPLDFAVPLLRECGDAEDPNLQEWWADLLASAVGSEPLRHVAFIHTLKSMSPADVKFLVSMLSNEPMRRDGRCEMIAKVSGMSVEQANISFHNLERLGFFTPTASKLKGFAFDFLSACYPHPDRISLYEEKQTKLGGHLVAD